MSTMEDQEVVISPALQSLIDAGVVRKAWVYSGYSTYLDETSVEGGGYVGMGDASDDSYYEHHSEYPPIFILNGTGWGDYGGSCVDRSNYRSLLREHPNTFIDMRGGFGSHELALPASFGRVEEEGWEGWAEDLARSLISMNHDYPLWDDEDHSRLEMELAEEAWDAYLGWDVRRELRDLGEGDAWEDKIDDLQDEWLRERYYSLTSESDNWPYCETATDVVFPDHDNVIKAIAEEIKNGE